MVVLYIYILVGVFLLIFPGYTSDILKWFYHRNPLFGEESFIYSKIFIVTMGLWFVISGTLLVYVISLAP